MSLSLPAALAFFLLYGVLGVPRLWHDDSGVGFLAASIVLALPLVMLSAVDLRQYRLPDALTLPLIGVGLLLGAWSGVGQVCWSALSAGLGFSLLAGIAYFYRRVRGRAGLGLGDAKLLAASGAWLGGQVLPTVLLWATGIALLCVVLAYGRGHLLSRESRLPFGPFLALGTWLAWLYGPIDANLLWPLA